MAGDWLEPVRRCCCVSQRYVFILMGFFCILWVYVTRNCLSLAITEMVIRDSRLSVVSVDTMFDWDEHQQGLILGAFYWGYVLSHLPAGLIADLLGAKHVINLGNFLASVFTILTPPLVYLSNWQGLVVARVIEGFGQGCIFPAMVTMIAHWVPPKDRSTVTAMVIAANQIGTVITNMTTGIIIEAIGTWESVFYIFGGIGCLWSLFFHFLCFSDPSTHPYIKDEEKEYLLTNIKLKPKGTLIIPWYGLFGSNAVWAMVIAHVGHDVILFAMATDLPKYIKVALEFTVAKNGLYTAIPYLLMYFMCLVSGVVADHLTNKKIMPVGMLRKSFTTVAQIGPALGIIAASYAGKDRVPVIILFTVAMGLMGPYYAGLKVNPLDIANNYAGTITAVVNGLGAVSGMFTPSLIGFVISAEGDPIELWRLVFWIVFGIAIVTSLVYIIFGSGRELYWNNRELYVERRTAQREKKRAKAERRAERNA